MADFAGGPGGVSGGSPVGSAFLERVFGRESRAAFDGQLIRFHLNEMNGLGDRLRFLTAAPDADASDELSTVKARITDHLEALALLGSGTQSVLLQAVGAVEERRRHPEDVFAPALALWRLSPPWWRAHAQDLPAVAHETITLWIGFPAGANQR